MKLQDLLKDLELGKVYTDKDRKPFKVNEETLNEFDAKMQKNHFLNLIKKEIDSLKGQIAYSKDKVNYKGTPDWEKKEFKGVLKDLLKKLKDTEKHYKRVQKLKEGIVSGGVVSGGSDAGRDVISKMSGGSLSRFGNLSNMHNWAGQYKDGLEFGLKNKVKVGGKVVSIVQIKVTGKDKYTIAYLDWDNGKRPLLTRKIVKNVSGKNLPKELKKSVKVG